MKTVITKLEKEINKLRKQHNKVINQFYKTITEENKWGNSSLYEAASKISDKKQLLIDALKKIESYEKIS